MTGADLRVLLRWMWVRNHTEADEQAMLAAVNRIRVRQGRQPLTREDSDAAGRELDQKIEEHGTGPLGRIRITRWIWHGRQDR